MIANPWVRPYVLTGGRTQTRKHPYLHTLVSVDRYDESASARLLPEARRLYERAAVGTQSVAELSAHCAVSLGVTRVLLEDLAAADLVRINDDALSAPRDPQLLRGSSPAFASRPRPDPAVGRDRPALGSADARAHRIRSPGPRGPAHGRFLRRFHRPHRDPGAVPHGDQVPLRATGGGVLRGPDRPGPRRRGGAQRSAARPARRRPPGRWAGWRPRTCSPSRPRFPTGA